MARAKGTIINFPTRAAAIGEDDAFWAVVVSRGTKDEYSLDYDTKGDFWKVVVRSSTFQGAEVMIEKCRHILGWDKTEIEDAAAN